MATNITSTQLDFGGIKDRLKDYLESRTEFTDYDFEAAGLSNILDVLAYNTHFNALTANFSLNEAFLNTAQLRSSVVSHADVLSLNIRSKTSSQVALKVSVDLSSASPKPPTITLPENSTFTATVDGTSYSFHTVDSYDAVDNGSGLYTFKNDDGEEEVLAYEGEIVNKTFYVSSTGEYQVYIIPDQNIDTATAKVFVYDSTTSSAYTEYTKMSEAITVDANSTYYRLKEAPNGNFELTFGDGVVYGKAPTSGQKIVVRYVRTAGDVANGASSLASTETITVNSTDYSLTVTTLSKSVGGAEKQSIESIRQEAPIAFASQQRLVTPLDYESHIRSNYTTVSGVKAWSGDQNVPIDYGKIYISLQFPDTTTASTKATVQNQIQTQLIDPLSVTSVTSEFVDPEDVYLECVTSFNYDPDLTGLTGANMESRVRNLLIAYFNTYLNSFDKVFRRSQILADIDELDNAILSSKMDVKVQMRLSPTFSASSISYDINFPMPISIPDDVNHIVKSENYYNSNGVLVFVRNKLNTTQLELINAATGDVITNNIGSYNAAKGIVKLDDFAATSVQSGNSYIKFSVTPANQAVVKPLRNYILKIDQEKIKSIGLKDDQNTKVSL
jgi:hypothetical protein|tara:strand:- start:2410 stop:4254 length:1845 start_codon:yes stop_codon:yes gene_type:complete